MTTRFAALFLTFCMLASCKDDGSNVKVSQSRLENVVIQISTASAWQYTGTTEVRLKQLDEWAAWDIDGTIKMLDDAQQLVAKGQADAIDQFVRARVAELEGVTWQYLARRILEYNRRLGGGVCAIEPATKEDAARARQRLTSARTPAGLDADLTRRVDTLLARARRVGGFHRAHCQRGAEFVLFGWIDKQAVPLYDLLEPMKAPAP